MSSASIASLSTVTFELRRRVFAAVGENPGDSILLSGGLDTSIIAAVWRDLFPKDDGKRMQAYTVLLKDAPSPDLGYSKLVSSCLHFQHTISTISLSELELELPEVIRVLKTFDPMEIRNSVVTYVGMKRARTDGRRKIMTGDASDELFAGYTFVFKQSADQAKKMLAHLWKVMRFSSIPLARSLNMEAILPFLHPAVKDLAMNGIDFSLLTGTRGGVHIAKNAEEEEEEKAVLFGKHILRKAFEDMLPQDIIWREKTPIECGSGTTILPKVYSQIISDSDFAERRKKYLEQDGVRLRDKEQLKYYEIFRKTLGPPNPEDNLKRTCPACTCNVPQDATFCTTCGEYPI